VRACEWVLTREELAQVAEITAASVQLRAVPPEPPPAH
jgi:hypothetical protein